jgi:hypothetical protein
MSKHDSPALVDPALFWGWVVRILSMFIKTAKGIWATRLLSEASAVFDESLCVIPSAGWGPVLRLLPMCRIYGNAGPQPALGITGRGYGLPFYFLRNLGFFRAMKTPPLAVRWLN